MQGDQNTCGRSEIRSNLPLLGEGMADAAGEPCANQSGNDGGCGGKGRQGTCRDRAGYRHGVWDD